MHKPQRIAGGGGQCHHAQDRTQAEEREGAQRLGRHFPHWPPPAPEARPSLPPHAAGRRQRWAGRPARYGGAGGHRRRGCRRCPCANARGRAAPRRGRGRGYAPALAAISTGHAGPAPRSSGADGEFQRGLHAFEKVSGPEARRPSKSRNSAPVCPSPQAAPRNMAPRAHPPPGSSSPPQQRRDRRRARGPRPTAKPQGQERQPRHPSRHAQRGVIIRARQRGTFMRAAPSAWRGYSPRPAPPPGRGRNGAWN